MARQQAKRTKRHGQDKRPDRAALLAAEQGTVYGNAKTFVALVKPSTYHVAMSSLGLLHLYRLFNDLPDVVAERAFLDPVCFEGGGPLRTLEQRRPVGDADIIAISVAYELELLDMLAVLEGAGLPLMARDRGEGYPLVVVGGPITMSNPTPLAPFADLVVVGEADAIAPRLVELYQEATSRGEFMDKAKALGPVMLTEEADTPPMWQLRDPQQPAYSSIITPHTDLANMHLVEAERGCPRPCTFCVMRRAGRGAFRPFALESVLATIPDHAAKVGLVGAAVTDHPQIEELVHEITSQGRQCSLSSLRADRLTEPLLRDLKAGGLRSLTISADGASQRLRDLVRKGISTEKLIAAADLARAHKLKIKLYTMIGLPGEEQADLEEMALLLEELSRRGRTTVAVSPFVPKITTPMADSPFAGIKPIEERLLWLRRRVGKRVDFRATSARQAWLEYRLSQGKRELAEVLVEVYRAGGKFSAWRRAFRKLT